MTAPRANSLIGQHIGKYRIAAELGTRGLGTVYEVVLDSIGHRAQAKILSGQLASDPRHEQYVGRFLDEARAVNLVDDAGVVRIFDFGDRPDGSVYILLEWLEGESVSQRLQRQRGGQMPRATPEQAFRSARQVAQTMARAHAQNLVHRELTPDNLFIVRDAEVAGGERVKILDFGLAKFLDTEERRTTAGIVLGTPAYMSPEQALGADQVGAPSDVYSLGVVLYEVLCGHTPFQGDMRTQLRAHVSQEPVPILQILPTLPGPAAELLHAMLAKPIEGRPSMAQVASRIAQIEEQGLFRQPPPPLPQTATPPPAPRWRPPLWLLAVLVLLGFLAGVLFAVGFPRGAPH